MTQSSRNRDVRENEKMAKEKLECKNKFMIHFILIMATCFSLDNFMF